MGDRLWTRPTSRSRKLLRLAEDILRLASRLAAAYAYG